MTKLTLTEPWCDSWLVTFPVSYIYSGGASYKVPPPVVPDGFELVNIGVGLDFNSRPPLATMYLKPSIEEELTMKQIERQDFMANAIHNLLAELAGISQSEMKWDIEIIEQITDIAETLICDRLKIMPAIEFNPYIREIK